MLQGAIESNKVDNGLLLAILVSLVLLTIPRWVAASEGETQGFGPGNFLPKGAPNQQFLHVTVCEWSYSHN